MPPPSGQIPATVTHRDAGVSDAIWEQLQADIIAQEEEKRKAAEEEQLLQQKIRDAGQTERDATLKAEALRRAIEESQDDEGKRQSLERELKSVQDRSKDIKAARARAMSALKEKLRKEEEMRKREQEMQEKLERSGRCPAGFAWVKQQGGYRCKGGSHFVSCGELGL